MSQYEYGLTFKYFREIKGFTMKETAEGIMSTQALRNFETGVSDTTLGNFLSLLERIFVTWHEFIAFHDEHFLDQLDNFDKEVNQMLHNKEYYELKMLGKKMATRYEETNSVIHFHFYILIKAAVFLAGYGDKPTLEEINSIKNHLKQIPTWSSYEQYLFGSFLFFLTVEEVNAFHKTALRKVATDLNFEETATNSPVLLIVNILSFYIKKEKFSEAKQFIQYSESFLNRSNVPSNLFQKILYKFQKGIVLIVFNDPKGIQACQSCIDALGEIGDYRGTINNLYTQLRDIRKFTTLKIDF